MRQNTWFLGLISFVKIFVCFIMFSSIGCSKGWCVVKRLRVQKIEVTHKKSLNKVNILRLGFLDSITPISTIEIAPDGLEYFLFFIFVKSTTICFHSNMSDNDLEIQYSINKEQRNYLFLIKVEYLSLKRKKMLLSQSCIILPSRWSVSYYTN